MKNIEINHFLDFKFPSAPTFSPDGKTTNYAYIPRILKNLMFSDKHIFFCRFKEY